MAEFSLRDQMAGLSRTQRGETIPEQKNILLRCTTAQHTVSKNKGTHGIEYTGLILEGEFEGEEMTGTAWYSTRTKNSVPFFMSQLYALGITPADVDSGATMDQLAEKAIGAIFRGTVSEEKADGKGGRARNQLIAESFEGGDTVIETLDASGGEDDLGGLEEFVPPPVPADDPADDGSAPDPDGTAGAKPEALAETAPAAAEDDAFDWDPQPVKS